MTHNRDKSTHKKFIKRVEEPYRINQRITAPMVRVVGEGTEAQICRLDEALQKAYAMDLDLVEISPQSDPPVCKIIDYSKFKYEQKKKQRERKANAHQNVVKEIRLGPNTEEHDLQFKLKHVAKFLQEGSKVKIYVQFSGRSIIFKERGELLLLKVVQLLEDVAKVDHMPKLEGRKMYLSLSHKEPKKS